MATAGAGEPRLAEHFPKQCKECLEVSEAFFACFTREGQKQGMEDAEAGARGLRACRDEMALYDACMRKYTQKRPVKLHRVQEEYRYQPQQPSSSS